jgi:putative Holliday junction resolvase
VNDLRIQQRILGVDFGRVRIGVAVSDELGLLAHPVETITATRGNPVKRIAEIAREKNVRQIVVGVPRHMGGDIGSSATEALEFAARLRSVAHCDVVTQDERLSTVAANRALRDSGRKTRNTRGYVDQVAAQMILQTYLDNLRHSADAE